MREINTVEPRREEEAAMRIAICDDDLREQEQLEKVLRGWDLTRSTERFWQRKPEARP